MKPVFLEETLVFKAHFNKLAKPDVYNIDTTNVLFILSGAFEGLDKIIKQRVAKGVCNKFSLFIPLTYL